MKRTTEAQRHGEEKDETVILVSSFSSFILFSKGGL
jgi:hypothetical protein